MKEAGIPEATVRDIIGHESLINHRLEREIRRAPAFTEPIERENY
jgi:hypothetical protein